MSDESIKKQFNKYLKKNKVNDLISSTTKIVLVCESPHTEELEMGLPLVGSAGKSLLKSLDISNDKGLGEYLYKNKIHTVGIMNVCRAPLQKTKSKKQSDFDFAKLSKIRRGYRFVSKHRNNALNEIENCIMDDFRKRLNQLATRNNLTKIVICGNFAKHYFCEVKQTVRQLPPVDFLPHPARNRWLKLSHGRKEILERLKHEIF